VLIGRAERRLARRPGLEGRVFSLSGRKSHTRRPNAPDAIRALDPRAAARHLGRATTGETNGGGVAEGSGDARAGTRRDRLQPVVAHDPLPPPSPAFAARCHSSPTIFHGYASACRPIASPLGVEDRAIIRTKG
jgi:hypothetical protein